MISIGIVYWSCIWNCIYMIKGIKKKKMISLLLIVVSLVVLFVL